MIERLKNALLEAIQIRLKGRKLICGICGGTRWQIIGISNIPIGQELSGSVVIGGPHIPMAITCCENCGNTVQFNIIPLLDGIEKYNLLIQECKTDAIIEQALK